MAIDVTRAALRLAPGAVNRSGERGVCGCRSSLTQQCEESESRSRKAPGAFYRLRPQRREVRPGASALLDGENLDLLVAHQDDIAAALPIGARALGQARRNPRGMPADYTFRSQFRVSMLSPLQRRRISARIVEPGPAPTLVAW